MVATREFAASICFLFAAFVCALGQGNGSLKGVVTDTTGASISGAVIVFTDQVTSETRSVSSDGQGRYSVQLAAGAYRVTVDPPYAAKFDPKKDYGVFAVARDEALENLIVDAGKDLSLDIVVEKRKVDPAVTPKTEKPTGYAKKGSVASEPQTA